MEVICIDEEWRDVRGFSGYQVSNWGRIRTHNKITYTELRGFRHWKDRIMKQKVDKQNNYRICIWKNGKPYDFLVARLIADAFCGEYRDTDLTVNHIDGNRLNNRADNLEWLTLADNIRDGFSKGLYSACKKRCVLIDEDGNKYEFESNADASRYLQRNSGYVGNCIAKEYDFAHDIHGNKYTIISFDFSPSMSPNTPKANHKYYRGGEQ